jgi:hypothetical protein
MLAIFSFIFASESHAVFGSFVQGGLALAAKGIRPAAPINMSATDNFDLTTVCIEFSVDCRRSDMHRLPPRRVRTDSDQVLAWFQ